VPVPLPDPNKPSAPSKPVAALSNCVSAAVKKGLKASRPDKALSAAFSCKGSCPTTEGANGS